MSRFEYQSTKLTNHVQRFVITTRVYNGLAEFTLRVRMMDNERAQPNSFVVDRAGVRLLARQHRTYVRGVGNSVVGTLPCHASTWQKSYDFGLYRPWPQNPDCL